MFALSRTWVEHDLFPMLSPPVYTYLQEKKKEGLRPSSSTHVRESPRTWGTRPGGKAGEEARDLSPNQRVTLASLGSQVGCSLGANSGFPSTLHSSTTTYAAFFEEAISSQHAFSLLSPPL